jgi:hypothetical protein
MTDEKEKQAEGEVHVTDKRRFTPEGEVRKPNSGSEEPKACEKEEKGTKFEQSASEQKLPPIDFVTFILSLATSAQVHLGAVPNPATGKQEQNISLAKETIDLLSILKDKTKGNLTSDEERLFEHVLYDLRMMYVESTKK